MDPVNVVRGADGGLYTVPVSPESEKRLQDSMRAAAENSNYLTTMQGKVAKAAAITLALGQIRAAIPGVGGTLFGAVLSGTGVGTGHVPVFGPALIGNFLPAPIGYLDEEATHIPHNYYLPAGSSQFIPRFADQLEKGFGLQRGEDEARATAQAARDLTQRAARLDDYVSRLPAQVVAELRAGAPVSDQTPLGRQINSFSLTEQRQSAARVSGVPLPAAPVDAPGLAPLLSDVTRSVTDLRAANQDVTLALIARAAALDEEEIRINPFLRVGGGAPLPDDAPPVGNLLAEAAKRAPPPMKFLDQARHDP